MEFKAKKGLGQNFLKSSRIADVMIEAGRVCSQDIVIEAGPGKGMLTEVLLSCARQVIAVEKDPRLYLYLSFKFKKEVADGKLKIITGDILEYEPAKENLRPGGYKIVANIPYMITGQFLRKFLTTKTAPSCMVLMLQKEVAERIVAHDGKESVLSISVKIAGSPKYIETVPSEMFKPKPKVDSAVMLIDDISRDAFKNIDEDHFFNLLHAGFSHKRKVLINNLSSLATKDKLLEVFQKYGIPEKARAENLSLSKWKQLTYSL